MDAYINLTKAFLTFEIKKIFDWPRFSILEAFAFLV